MPRCTVDGGVGNVQYRREAPVVGKRAGFLILAVAAFAAILIASVGLGTAAQEETPASTNAHAMVGTWFVGQQGDAPGLGPTLATFFADGNVLIYAAAGTRPVSWQGVWIPDGPRAATFTIVAANVDQTGAFAGNATLTGTNVIDDTGDRYTTTGLLTLRDPVGQVVSTIDVVAIGSRVVVAPIASPIATPGA